MSEIPQPYPLRWPAGKPRTPVDARKRAAFGKAKTKTYGTPGTDSYHSYQQKGELSIADGVARLQSELDKLGARLPVISSNLELRLDGLPRSNQAMPGDPGVACYFRLQDRPLVLACDRYDRVADNIAAIAAHIDAMRTAERHGVGSLEQMFTGFTALPGAVAPDDWREPLGGPTSLAQAEANYRERMKYAHPDTVSEDDRAAHEIVAAKLNAAIAAARVHWGTG